MKPITYVAEPTLVAFHADNSDVKGVMGPIGSGKSVGCCMDVLSRSMQQAPDANGVRKTRWAIIRQTYPELKSTTIQTWQEWLPQDVCPITFGSPIEGRMKAMHPDGVTTIDMHIYFLAIDQPRDAKKLLSLELTGVWINEAREMSYAIVKAAFSRTGRFPKKADAPTTWTGLIMDTNPPDDDHWWYKLAEEKKPSNYAFFRQPGAILPVRNEKGHIVTYEANPAAENVQNHTLGYRYWMRLVEGADPEWILVHCCGEYGSVFDGKPVYQGIYNDQFHASPVPLGVFKGLPIWLGWDFGLTPACIVGQITPTGQLRILREYVCKRGGIKQFASDTVIPQLATLFNGMKIISWADPAGGQASQADELTCLTVLKQLGIPTEAALSTNSFVMRRQQVINRLTRTIDAEPAILIDPSCKWIRRGFIGGYKFERIQVSGDERYKDVPCKNAFSHPHDALQYLIDGTDSVAMQERRYVPPPPPDNWGGAL